VNLLKEEDKKDKNWNECAYRQDLHDRTARFGLTRQQIRISTKITSRFSRSANWRPFSGEGT
jgi:hypothetical protein